MRKARAARTPDDAQAVFVRILTAHGDAARAYRHLSKALHPDAGGSTEMMAALNAAWQRVGDELA